MPRLSKIGAAALAAFGWTSGGGVTVDFLVIAGGGSGGAGNGGGGGGGAGGYRCSVTGESSGGGASAEGKLSLSLTQSYTVIVGAGGAGTGSVPYRNSGSNSVFSSITSTGGGGGGYDGTYPPLTGGSGGGGNYSSTAGAAGTANQGFAGGANTASSGAYGGGGGGGAAAIGAVGTSSVGGNGGNGVASSISGSSVTRAGGGGGGSNDSSAGGTGGSGGGGNGGNNNTNNATAGSASTGSGGGAGGGGTQPGRNGGSGVVIISYVGAQKFGGGVVTVSGGNTIHTFTTSGTLSPLNALTVNFLVVAGGGGGGYNYHTISTGGGGGAGGYRTSSGLTIDTNSTYLVTVGAGGAGAPDTSTNGGVGTDSFFSTITSAGGGYGATNQQVGGNGGSGGGASGPFTPGSFAGGLGNTPATSPVQGFDGGSATQFGGGGGGGSSAAGQISSLGGAGGAGTPNSISGASVTYASGGGSNNAGGANVGDGGGRGTGGANNPGFAGGSGVVIISYPGSTQQMAGGTVTVAGGNVIHTFTSSGFLTPIVLTTNSLRFRASATAYLNRTGSTATNAQKATYSFWFKRGALTTGQWLFTGGASGAVTLIGFNGSSDAFSVLLTDTAGEGNITTAVFRDPSAWYHFVIAIDTTQATTADRAKIYVNGVLQAVTVANGGIGPSTNWGFNTANTLNIGRYTGASSYTDGYMTEINFIDGLALTPFSFGTTSDLGVWQPIRYGGSYGNNGFYLKFTDTTNTTTLGYDSSPNSNNWTTNNISLTAGTTYDSMTDVPTLTSATVANYATINALDYNSTYLTLSAANLQQTYAGVAAAAASRATMTLPTTGKYYWEVTLTTIGTNNTTIRAGICSPTTAISGNSIDGSATSYLQITNGQKRNNASDSTYGAGFSNGQILQVLYDATAGAIYFGQNNSFANGSGSFNQAFSTATAAFTGLSGEFMPCFITYGGSDIAVNFGQRPFTYTPPTDFKALNTFNLTTPTIGATPATTANKYFDALLYTGNGSASQRTDISWANMQPDMVWIKNRTSANNHVLHDDVRGTNAALQPNLTNATDSPVGFGADGFGFDGVANQLRIFTSDGRYNTNGNAYVTWGWKGSGAAGVTNTAGSITSTVSANTSAGFSIVTYTGNNTLSTVGHGLGVAPSVIIVKDRSASNPWPVYHVSLGVQYYTLLNSTDASYNNLANYWGSSAPTSTTFSINAYGGINTNADNYVAYCFAAVSGYSAFGSYTGNGSSDGPFVFTGFRPRFVLIRRTDSGPVNGFIWDTSRDTYNVAFRELYPDQPNAESTSTNSLDILSNGIKLRTSSSDRNANGGNYIYMVFAENPFKYANAR